MPTFAAMLAAFGPWIVNLFREYGPKLFASFLGTLGIIIATNEIITEPVMTRVMSAWGGIPGNFGCWLGAVGVIKMASICVSSLSLLAGKKLFFAKRGV